VTQLLDVATGRLDANCQQQGRIWDFVAAGLVVQEAGGRLTDWRGRPLFPLPDLQAGHVPTLAAAANVHPTLCRWLRGCPLPASS
jgi:fructose-1,6-bisphosphatase/inositol monophosphatase family enzyme